MKAETQRSPLRVVTEPAPEQASSRSTRKRRGADVDLASPALYINRELSLLEFNRRVLAQAKDARTPLLERLRFLTICTTNLDEFFEIRVAGLKQQVSYELGQAGPDNLSAQETLSRISEVAHALVQEQYSTLNDHLLPALEDEGIYISRRDRWTPAQRRWIHRYFQTELLPVLTPVGLDPAHPFPRVLNKSLTFIVALRGVDAFGRDGEYAVVTAPRLLPRVVRLPPELSRGTHDFVLLSSIIHDNVGDLFPGMECKGCYQFRLTRNSELWVEEEEVDDLLHALEGELTRRNFGDSVRLEIADNCPDEVQHFLLEQFELRPDDLYKVNGPVNLYRLARIYDLVERPDLKFPAFAPALPRALGAGSDIFEVLRRGDVLLHHPYESFAPVLELLRRAASDPDVVAIKQTLYRTGTDSPIVEALIQAAQNGKEVTAVVELRARFDEAANIDLATRLQEAGANVVYGVVGYKTHAKVLLIVRREGRRLRYYTHFGTGNYHVRTARAYTDFSYLTASREFGEDAHKIFLQLTGLGRSTRVKKLLQAPFALQKTLVALIEQEANAARHGAPARIIAKLNALSEPKIIRALYAASRAGVQIDLLVRGVCCLRPGIPGISENIRVRSIVGRFLEHSRVYYFHAGGAELLYCASADWMNRNFFRRVETAFPVENETLKRRVISEALLRYLEDNTQAWILQSDGGYRRAKPGKERPRVAQTTLLAQLSSEPPVAAPRDKAKR